MKYMGMPMGMWGLFESSFRRQLTSVFGIDVQTANRIAGNAKERYREIIRRLPEFEKRDRFKMNIVSCAMLSAFLLSLPGRPSVEKTEEYYRESMMTGAMKWFCRQSGKRKFSEKDLEGMKMTAAFRAADRNPYSWNMEYYPYGDGSGYEARFTHCGICMLMNELGLREYIPAMCRLDYTMSEAGGASRFVRKYTLASGGPYCDCGYLKKN
ncbi:MAG: L-2-amino-thiazoline-4-carboxylic acid hydrolase [Clostridia bacterium]|nr:L-2-amino-thiazoline-4-carboxylic acid hydrolase [Clostridia bacterium]